MSEMQLSPATVVFAQVVQPFLQGALASRAVRLGHRSLVLCLALAAGCGTADEELPAACGEGEAAFLAALRSAPEAVRVDGVALSECLTAEADAGEVQRVGAGFVGAATALAEPAAREPEGPAALRMGYLIGAARRGARGTQGVHSELLRRLDQEGDPLAERGSSAFARGVRAARRGG